LKCWTERSCRSEPYGRWILGANLLPRDKLSHAAVREIVVTDTVEAAARPPIAVVSVGPLLAGAIQRFLVDGSLSDLY
jgi:phosphoribosylpyrophosphate synthetase